MRSCIWHVDDVNTHRIDVKRQNFDQPNEEMEEFDKRRVAMASRLDIGVNFPNYIGAAV